MVAHITPPRPVDLTAVFPALAPLARTAARLHPRPATLTPHDSSVGGPLLWPATEPWPHCHAEECSTGGPESDNPFAMVPVAQLYVRDVPGLHPPEGMDLLQVLWCPIEHDDDGMPKTALFWRSAAAITDVLVDPPKPADFESYLISEPCMIDPEQVIEYPNSAELEGELGQQVSQWTMARIPGVEFGDLRDEDQPYNHLCIAPGWKIGGFINWSMQDPYPCPCPTCGAPTEPLLTIASSEWDFDIHHWIPYEDQAANIAWGAIQGGPSMPTRICVSDLNDLIIRVCPASPEHPHIQMLQ